MRKVVLLVEDEPDLLQVLATALARALPDCDVKPASSADEAESVLGALATTGQPLALVLADHQLSGDRTGLALLGDIRTRHPAAAAFLFTGTASPDVADGAIKVGARVLWKPLRLSALVSEVQSALG
jgi:DNA-binding NtrC family response regulator